MYAKDLGIGHTIEKFNALKKPENGLSSSIGTIVGAELLRAVKHDEQVKLIDIKGKS